MGEIVISNDSPTKITTNDREIINFWEDDKNTGEGVLLTSGVFVVKRDALNSVFEALQHKEYAQEVFAGFKNFDKKENGFKLNDYSPINCISIVRKDNHITYEILASKESPKECDSIDMTDSVMNIRPTYKAQVSAEEFTKEIREVIMPLLEGINLQKEQNTDVEENKEKIQLDKIMNSILSNLDSNNISHVIEGYMPITSEEEILKYNKMRLIFKPFHFQDGKEDYQKIYNALKEDITEEMNPQWIKFNMPSGYPMTIELNEGKQYLSITYPVLKSSDKSHGEEISKKFNDAFPYKAR